jgi:hypothetical protein
VCRRIAAPPAKGNLILVTHQVNISALSGVFPASGEMIVLTPLEMVTFVSPAVLRPMGSHLKSYHAELTVVSGEGAGDLYTFERFPLRS